ncbi:FecR family protein [Dongia sedimenti]|uniref:FecR family protein n=1 Tax=Dongia sedimenti TaxID=3064282 RepID=A0ABU0YMT1_9PROT|nr:FecR family protein [Rhodospirillaceae bacterium R-7]
MGKYSALVAGFAGLGLLAGAAIADTVDVGAIEKVQRTVYGEPPQGGQTVKRQGDGVVFQEALETVDNSAAVIRFIDDSTLSVGARSKVLIDAFVFDPEKAEGNALIRISIGTLRFVTGGMPKGKTTIKTPTATLVLRGTDVTVHVHPDGTTDATVNEGIVDAHNDVTNNETSLTEGQGGTFANGGNSDFSGSNPSAGPGGSGDPSDPPEHRRSGNPAPTGGDSHNNSSGGSSGY